MTKRIRHFIITLFVLGTLLVWITPAMAQKVELQFWHGLAQPLGGILEKIVADFNASQTHYHVNATFKGSYPDTMVAAIAAFRAGNAPPYCADVRSGYGNHDGRT